MFSIPKKEEAHSCKSFTLQGGEKFELTAEEVLFLQNLQKGDNLDNYINQCAETICFIASVLNQINQSEREEANLLMTDLTRFRNNLKNLRKPE